MLTCLVLIPISHKKDEFFLNRKRVQKSEVVSLLESAGFSKSNPYYIVQQGKVANLCVMKDKDRLNLLKEVAGTTVYEERRAESVKIMDETISKRSKVEEVLTFIDERLNELDEEKKELVEYEKYDKQRRALEYSIYDKEYTAAATELAEIEAARDTGRVKQQALYAEIRDVQDELSTEEDHLQMLKAGITRLITRRDAKAEELTTLQARKSEAEMELQELEIGLNNKKSSKVETINQLEQVKRQIAHIEQQIAALDPQIEELTNRQAAENEDLINLRKRLDWLYGKQGRGQQFNSKAERDKFLQSQINALTENLERKEELIAQDKADLANEEARINKERKDINTAESANRARSAHYEQLTKAVHEQIATRNSLQERRKNNWKELELLQDKILEAKQEVERGKQQLSKTLPRSVTQGISIIEYIVQEKKLKGYYGPLIDNIVLKSEAFRTAVEVAAGPALFHVIVDNDETASILIKELEVRGAGRLTFLPLNRLRTGRFNYPDSTDVHPLISVALEYEARIEPAVKLVSCLYAPKSDPFIALLMWCFYCPSNIRCSVLS